MLSTHVATLDSQIRVKQAITFEDLREQHFDPNRPIDDKEGALTMIDMYAKLVKDSNCGLLVRKLAEAVAMQPDEAWDAVLSDVLPGTEGGEEVGYSDNDDEQDIERDELERVLTFGMQEGD